MSVKPLQQNISLKDSNTFGVDVLASQYAEFSSKDELRKYLDQAEAEPWILGGGSNILLVDDVQSCVLKNAIGGVRILSEHDDEVRVSVGGGVVWHDLVTWAVENGYGGIENLALIPGSVGAAPLQNIGAYGVELREVFVELEAVNLASRAVESFDHAACAFGYRDSIFKSSHKDQYCITGITLRLTRHVHRIETSYGAIQDTLVAMSVDNPGIRDVYKAVMTIRSSKLPDPALIGNAGSFFKNPVVPLDQFQSLKTTYPEMPVYPVDEYQYKIPAGWLIERAGWKGRREGNVGCYDKQALVIVNYGGASGLEIYDFAMRIRNSVKKQFGIQLTPEVNLVGS